jgi:Na+/H+-dicarboxylate symporter
MKAATNMGLKREITSFSFPLDATVKMDGAAIFQGVAVVFLASFIGVELSLGTVIIVVLTATLSSVGSAGVPGSALLVLSIVLTSIGIPMEAIAMIFGIDRIIDMGRTTINVFGDFVYTMVVAKQENMIDWEQFNAPTNISSVTS